MAFPKGNTYNRLRKDGNRSGPPRSYASMPELLKEVAAQPYAGGLTYKERIARVVLEQAARGVPWAVEFFVNRTEGKLTDRVEQSGTVRQVIEVDYGHDDRDPD